MENIGTPASYATLAELREARSAKENATLLALRATDLDLRSAQDRARLAGLERLSAARLRVAFRTAAGG